MYASLVEDNKATYLQQEVDFTNQFRISVVFHVNRDLVPPADLIYPTQLKHY